MEFLSNINIQFYLLAYIVGSIPFGLILAKVFAKVDIKSEGSGNIGATNVLRVVKEKDPVLAKKLGIATLLLDVLKGVVVLLIAKYAGVSEETMWAVAVFVVLGHCFSLFLLLEGGKGVAAGVGVLAFMIPYATLFGLAIWALVIKGFKISSLASLLGLLAVVVASFYFYPNIAHSPIVFIAMIIAYKHGDNIGRLLTFKESKIA